MSSSHQPCEPLCVLKRFFRADNVSISPACFLEIARSGGLAPSEQRIGVAKLACVSRAAELIHLPRDGELRTVLARSLPPWHCHGRGGTAPSGHRGLKYRLAGS